ncbi:type 2 phosphatidylinositol 4,5-bisphosphate 4-phosphatase-like [Sycon ciliatum]|uniref:type 2 phosphatidylinositol 4,5-bisphosphate 4-phosphatase-like n=1 Tax=Sycon ciliatum TaxID=27933 RepID=UPI0020AB201E|eukprot:scpid63200/ scgid17918/ Transmembrane protein 55A; PtdIns-4,5-P2 4-Ptase II; Type II phosphatidylinositol 4,5-bisphosphate 4-phosphatase
MADLERAPLVTEEVAIVDPSTVAQPPPPYSEEDKDVNADVQNRRRVACQVCRTNLTFADRSGLRVVTCSRCQEATPVGAPPAGKKYVRCTCNCLLTCSTTARQIICPRANCKRTVSVGGGTSTDRVTCRNCNVTTRWTARGYSSRRCSRCHSLMPISEEMMKFARGRAILFIILGLVCTLLAIGVLVATILYAPYGVVAVPIGLFSAGVYFFARAGLYLCSVSGATIE